MNAHRTMTCRSRCLFFAIAMLITAPAALADRLSEGIAAFKAEEYEHAYKLLKPEAAAGDVAAQYYLAQIYDHGLGRESDDDLAMELYFTAAQRGHTTAQVAVAYSYAHGLGVEQDWKESVRWYRKAAEAGDPSAQRSMGLSYKNGEGVKQDYGKAVEWFHKAAEQGDADAQYELGIAYYEGRGVDRDYDQSAHWNKKAAEAGKIHSRRLLAWHYIAGEGVKEDLERAKALYRSLLPEGEARDRFALGVLLQGEGQERNDEASHQEAYEMFDTAAFMGHARAMAYLGLHYFNGWGVDRDWVEAHAWYMLGYEYGYEGAGQLLYMIQNEPETDEAALEAAVARANEIHEELESRIGN